MEDPAVVSGGVGGRDIGHLCGTCDDLHGLMGGPPDVAAFALGSLDGLGLHGFTLLLDRFGHLDGSLRPGGHLGFIGGFLAHMWAVNLVSLAGMAQLPHVPHNLGEVVASVSVVGPAEVGFALKVAGVGPPRVLALAWAFAGDTQASVVPSYGHQNGAGVLGLGAEADGLVPDAVVGLSV